MTGKASVDLLSSNIQSSGGDINRVDLLYLRDLYSELDDKLSEQSRTLVRLEGQMQTTNVILRNIEKKNSEQDLYIGDLRTELKGVGLRQAGCNASIQVKSIWHQIKRINDILDVLRKDYDIDTQRIDVYKQRAQHDAETSVLNNAGRDIFMKILPWLLIGIVAGAGLAGIGVYQYFEKKESIVKIGK